MTIREIIMGKAKDNTPVKVNTPELGVDVFVERAPASKAVQLGQMFSSLKEAPSNVVFVIAFAVDEAGKNIFTIEDVDLVNSLPMAAVSRIAEKAIQLNMPGADAVGEAEKN